MIGPDELAQMKKGSYLLNASRGSVVVIPALAAAVKSGHLAGAAIDVFPEEPEANGEGFKSELQGLPNVILTPHIGGSTAEAQVAIGREVATALIRFVNQGATTGAVNFPQVELPPLEGRAPHPQRAPQRAGRAPRHQRASSRTSTPTSRPSRSRRIRTSATS